MLWAGRMRPAGEASHARLQGGSHAPLGTSKEAAPSFAIPNQSYRHPQL